MKVTHNKIGNNLNITDTKLDRASQSDKSSGAAKALAESAEAMNSQSNVGASRVEVSERAQDMKKIKELAMKAPDVDVEKVARLQKLIDQGQYKVDAKAIADRMVDEELQMGT
jgi:negative regulator of flagellin synthesis FlgM